MDVHVTEHACFEIGISRPYHVVCYFIGTLLCSLARCWPPQVQRAMGSRGCFSPHECGGWMFPSYPTFDKCEWCDYERTYTFISSLLPLRLPVSGPLEIVVGYFTFNHLKARRLYFLREVLLARSSDFRKFTYYYNGRMGGIDQWTDIITYLLQFLHVTTPEAWQRW